MMWSKHNAKLFQICMEGDEVAKSQKGKSETAGKVSTLMNHTLLTDIRNLILSARRQVAQAINGGLTILYWEI